MVKFLLIRHGQSVGNERGIFCGLYDTPLSNNGKLQGDIVCDYVYENYKVLAIYSSKLKRAYQTVERLSCLTGLKVKRKKAFNELYGGKWEGKTPNQLLKQYNKEYSLWQKDIGVATPVKGEAWENMQKRLFKFLDKLVKKYKNKNGVIVIATHGGDIRLLETILSGKTLADMKNVPWVPNCSLTTLIYSNGKYKIKESGFCDYLGDNKTNVPKGI